MNPINNRKLPVFTGLLQKLLARRSALPSLILMAAGAALVLSALFAQLAAPAPLPVVQPQFASSPSPPSLPEASAPPPQEPPVDTQEQAKQEEIPAGLLLITPAREGYERGTMTLKIPRLGIDAPIESGVDDNTLKAGPGLYDYAQLPGEPGGNVSIAGHRDIHGSVFYYLHHLDTGDLFYLVYNNMVYTYLYEDTVIVTSRDWGPIHTQGFSCLTLTSCDPIGTSLNRIIVTARLLEATPYTPDYAFSATSKPASYE